MRIFRRRLILHALLALVVVALAFTLTLPATGDRAGAAAVALLAMGAMMVLAYEITRKETKIW